MDIQQLSMELQSGWEVANPRRSLKFWEEECYVDAVPTDQCNAFPTDPRSASRISLRNLHRVKPAEVFPLNLRKKKLETLKTGDDYQVNLTRNLSYKYRSFVNTAGFVQNREYKLERELHFENSTSSKDESSSRVIYPKLDIQILIVRSHFYWFINVAIPLYIFVSISLTSFIFDTQELADRLTINLTVLLTTVAYKYIIAEKLPDINYLTVLDVYLLACLFLEYLLIVYNVLAYAGTIPVSSNFKDNAVDYMLFAELCWLLASGAYGALSEIIINLHDRERKSKWANPANVLWIAVPPNNELHEEHDLYELQHMPYSADQEKVFKIKDDRIDELMNRLDKLCNPEGGPQDNGQTEIVGFLDSLAYPLLMNVTYDRFKAHANDSDGINEAPALYERNNDTVSAIYAKGRQRQ
ncbi:hypothetical protein CYMTET_7628 [Cymbomonas tetramitiformis]|uniref:Uncharacterized protein n=1 Tax=Cymbomonas tetramitiformis TaxID=36881 RepID=A0AAE0GWL0_9CHLO|nr:hypothetical protein CYMTET_7628 [Cymbomonas tetramitiformis]